MDETPAQTETDPMDSVPMWLEKVELGGQHFATAKEYTDYMTAHRLWGPHPKHPTHEEWEIEKAKRKAESGVELGTPEFVLGKFNVREVKSP